MKLFALTGKGCLFIPVAFIMFLATSCGFLPGGMRDTLDKGMDIVLAGRIRSVKKVTVSAPETAGTEKGTSVQAVRDTPRPVSRARAGDLSSGQMRLPASTVGVRGTAVLCRGNDWSKGIPGFGENIFPCFFGEYQINIKSGPADSGAENAEKTFSVRASKEPLLFSEENWQMLPPIRTAGGTVLFPEDEGEESSAAGYTAMRRLNDEHYIIALILNDAAYHEVWRIFFEFPQDNGGFDLDTAQINRLIGEWATWFLYFRASAQNPGELSFPAVLTF